MINRTPSRMFPFIAGLALGILATVYLPSYIKPYLPQWIAGKMVAVKGTVAAKQKKDKELLLTVNTADGVLLATFKRKVDEINLLINANDSIEFNLPKYMPFIEDPKIIRVVKEQPAPAAAPAEQKKETGAREPRTKSNLRTSAAVTVSGTTGTIPGSGRAVPK